jgi:hypothetical protein
MDKQTFPDEITFIGPLDLCPDDSDHWEIEEIAAGHGVYLFTVEVNGSYRILYVGEGEHIAKRIREHLSSYLSGKYTMYDSALLREGKRRRVEGYPCLKTENVLLKVNEHRNSLVAMLQLVRIFVCRIDCGKPTLRRLESAIIRTLRENHEANEFIENDRLSVDIQSDQRREIRVGGAERLFALGDLLLA